MREHLPRIVVVALLVLVTGLPFALRPLVGDRTLAPATHAGQERLIIISPHNEQIRHEFSRAFNQWRIQQGLEPVAFDWRASGGTTELRRQVIDQFTRLASQNREDDGIGIDLFFGGGEFDHNLLRRGVTTTRNGRDLRISASVPLSLNERTLRMVFPEPTIGGEALYDPQRYWVGTALSSFGIVYNRDVMRMLDRPSPRTWADMADPAFANWVALADPGHSGSLAATYHVIVRRMGWNEGWAMLRDVFANTRYFSASASRVPVDVSQGNAGLGMSIDFYGRYQAGAIGGDRVGYVDPPFMTAITADPISLMRGAPNRELAEMFVQWLLTEEAQRLWQRRVGTPDGPQLYELRRMPIRRDLYTDDERRFWSDPDLDPFASTRPISAAMPEFFRLISPIAHAIGIDIHADLKAAREALERTADSHPHKTRMRELFTAMPPELTLVWPDADLAAHWAIIINNPNDPRYERVAATLRDFIANLQQIYLQADPRERLERQLAWTLFFRDNYREVVRLSRQR